MSTKSLSEVTDVFIYPKLGLAQCLLPRPTLGPGPGSPHPWDHVSICPWAPWEVCAPCDVGNGVSSFSYATEGFSGCVRPQGTQAPCLGHLRRGVSVWVRESSRSLPCFQSLLHQQHSLCTGGSCFCLSVQEHTVLSWRENGYKKVPSLRHFHCILIMCSFSKLHELLYF